MAKHRYRRGIGARGHFIQPGSLPMFQRAAVALVIFESLWVPGENVALTDTYGKDDSTEHRLIW